jgi:site-specific DNA-methyltransferase (adenine-specific)
MLSLTYLKRVLMQEYYRCDNYVLYLGDTFEVLEFLKLHNVKVDLIFADPPYFLSTGETEDNVRKDNYKGDWDKVKGIEYESSFHYNWIDLSRKLLSDKGSLWLSGTYHNIYYCGYALKLQDWYIINEIIWYKLYKPLTLTKNKFPPHHETLIWARKSKDTTHYFSGDCLKPYNWYDSLNKKGSRMGSVWSINRPSKDERKFGYHPTQKPLNLLERVVLSTSLPNTTVLDPFCGTSTTGVAAIKNNRFYIGIDQSEEFLEMSKKRIDDVLLVPY